MPLTRWARAKGRFLGGEPGEPMADRELRFGVNVPLGDGPNPLFVTSFGGSVKTDRGGRFDLTGLVAGQKYSVDLTLEKNAGWRGLKTFVPSAGEAVDLGDGRPAPEFRPPTLAAIRKAAFQ